MDHDLCIADDLEEGDVVLPLMLQLQAVDSSPGALSKEFELVLEFDGTRPLDSLG
jgi:hypothetical protein